MAKKKGECPNCGRVSWRIANCSCQKHRKTNNTPNYNDKNYYNKPAKEEDDTDAYLGCLIFIIVAIYLIVNS